MLCKSKMLFFVTFSPKYKDLLDVTRLLKKLEKHSEKYIYVEHEGNGGEHSWNAHLVVSFKIGRTADVRRKIKNWQIYDSNEQISKYNLQVKRADGEYGGYLFHEDPQAEVKFKGEWDIETMRKIGKKMKIVYDADKLSQEYVKISYTKVPFVLAQICDYSELFYISSSREDESADRKSFIKLCLSKKISPVHLIPHYKEIMETALVLKISKNPLTSLSDHAVQYEGWDV